MTRRPCRSGPGKLVRRLRGYPGDTKLRPRCAHIPQEALAL